MLKKVKTSIVGNDQGKVLYPLKISLKKAGRQSNLRPW